MSRSEGAAFERRVDLSPDHLAVLAALRDAGGSAILRDLIDAVAPGTSTAPRRDFATISVRWARAVGECQRWGLLAPVPLSTRRVLTDLGRAALSPPAAMACA